MDWSEILTTVLKLFVIPIVGILSTFIVNYLKVKIDSVKVSINSDITKKYLDMVEKTVTDCVVATNQTFVDVLKRDGKFDKQSQKEAFEITKTTVINILTDEMKDYLVNIVGDLDLYLNSLIEANVQFNKNNCLEIRE